MSHFRIACVALSALLFTAASPAQLLQGPGEDEQLQLRANEALGLRLYRHDRAAALASNVLLDKHKYRKDKRVQGWLTEARESSVLMSFIGARAGEEPTVLYQIDIADGANPAAEVVPFDPPRPLSESQHRAWLARKTALSSGFGACSKHYNSVILPSADSGSPGWSVFLLPTTNDSKVLPFGGTYRVEVSADGGNVLTTRAYSKTCLSFTRDKKGGVLVMSHLLDPLPTEIHVLLNLYADVPLRVITAMNRREWEIDKGKIRFVRRLENNAPAQVGSTDDTGDGRAVAATAAAAW